MPKVSVIVPVYKVESYLRRCIDSILGQSFPDFELILVDDGSPDDCGAICDEYASKDSRIYVIHQKNGGLSAARNAGIDWAFANSDSRWLAFVDSDDWIHRDYLKLLMGAAEKYNVKVVMGDYRWVSAYCDDDDLSDAEAGVMGAEDAFFYHYPKCTPAWGKIFEKQLFAGIRFPVGKLYEDTFVTYILIFNAGDVAVYQEKLIYYFNNPNSITRGKWSERKLDSIDAHEQRLAYFHKNGYQKAYHRQWIIYIQELTYKIQHLVETRETKTSHQDTMLLLQRKLRKALKQARKDGILEWNGETVWAYLFASPVDIVWKTALAAQKIYHNLKK